MSTPSAGGSSSSSHSRPTRADLKHVPKTLTEDKLYMISLKWGVLGLTGVAPRDYATNPVMEEFRQYVKRVETAVSSPESLAKAKVVSMDHTHTKRPIIPDH